MLDSYPYDFQAGSVGITFHLPSRSCFIPNAWLARSELNREGTAIEVHYTHCLVTIQGKNLGALHEHLARFGIGWIQEFRMPKPDDPSVTRIEIAEKSEG